MQVYTLCLYSLFPGHIKLKLLVFAVLYTFPKVVLHKRSYMSVTGTLIACYEDEVIEHYTSFHPQSDVIWPLLFWISSYSRLLRRPEMLVGLPSAVVSLCEKKPQQWVYFNLKAY